MSEKNLVLFAAFGVLIKTGTSKTYTDKKTGEVKSIQDFKAGNLKFSVFGQKQIEFQEKLLDLPVIAFGRLSWRQDIEGNYHQQFQVDSCRRDYTVDSLEFDIDDSHPL